MAKHEGFITRKELIVVSCIALFALIWTGLVMIYFMQWEWFKVQIPPVQFLIFNSGFVVIFIVMLGLPLTYLINKRKGINIISAIKLGLGAYLGIGLLFDLFEPPYYVGLNGNILIDNPDALTGTSVDAMLIWCWTQLGVSGSALYWCTYLITPIIIMILIALLFTWKKFARLLGGK